VQESSESIVVFSPYLDSMLDRLLKNSALAADAITVVTDFSPSSGAIDYRAQLTGMRALMRRGIEVRSLPRLHAKVLLCDWQTATAGSQNFTSYGRGSNEVTVVPADDLSRSQFVATLREWLSASAPVDLEIVERLLTGLESEMRTVRSAQAALAAAFERVTGDYQHELDLERRRQADEERRRREQAALLAPMGARLSSAVRSTRERLARREVLARLTEVGDQYRYKSLVAEGDSSLTRWITRPPGQAVSYLPLTPLRMYPVILNPSGRMGFGRIGESRVSYVRDAVTRMLPRLLAGMRYRIGVDLPGEDFERANLHITLRPQDEFLTRTVKFLVRFVGDEACIVDNEIAGDGAFREHVPGSGWRTWSPEDVIESFASPENLDRLMNAALDSFKYSELRVWDHNAGNFFPEGWLRVTVVEYASRPVFVVSE
jgi:hypothetical protein